MEARAKEVEARARAGEGKGWAGEGKGWAEEGRGLAEGGGGAEAEASVVVALAGKGCTQGGLRTNCSNLQGARQQVCISQWPRGRLAGKHRVPPCCDTSEQC